MADLESNKKEKKKQQEKLKWLNQKSEHKNLIFLTES